MGYTNHTFVLIAKIDGTIVAKPMPTEKIGV
jgi:hypothetical protein